MKLFNKALSFLLVVFILISSLAACNLLQPKEKEFSDSGMTITLTEEFFEKEYVGFTTCYQSTDVLVFVLKEEISSFPAEYRDYNTKQYAQLVCEVNKLSDAKITEGDEYSEFDYEKTVNDDDYYYYARCFKSDDAFWLVQFACFTDKKDEFAADFDKWASTFTFENE